MSTDTTPQTPHPTRPARQQQALDLWARRLATLAVAGVAAYASYQHQRDFALAGGADLTTARLWPFSVDGLLVLSTAGLLRDGRPASRRVRVFLWAAFAAGIIVSLAANIATAPSMSWAPILVAGWPPVALLLAVELLGHRRRDETEQPGDRPDRDEQRSAETSAGKVSETESRAETGSRVVALDASRLSRRTAEQVMWEYYRSRVGAGLSAPTGAELDAVAHTNNYGRAVLRKWRRKGRTEPSPSITAVR